MTSWQLRRTIWEALWVSSLLAMSSSQVLSLICFRSWFFSMQKQTLLGATSQKDGLLILRNQWLLLCSPSPASCGGFLWTRECRRVSPQKKAFNREDEGKSLSPASWYLIWFFLKHWVSITCEYHSAPNTLTEGKIPPFPGTWVSRHYS